MREESKEAGAAEVKEAKGLLDQLAGRTRAAGSSGEAQARKACADYLRTLGFVVHEEPFTYSAFAGSMATPLAGVALISMFASTVVAAAGGQPGLALVVFSAHVLLLSLIGSSGRSRAILHSRLLRRTSVNLVARVGMEEPRLWLVAHLDSKSQPVSILARAAGVTVTLIVALLMAILLVQEVLGGIPIGGFWVVAGAVGALASIPLVMSVVGNESRGALDNASGVSAVLRAASSLSQAGVKGYGVLLTSAEEVGLAGAHAWCAAREPGISINCDSVDDVGDFLCLTGTRRVGRALAALREAAGETPIREQRMLVGVLVDSMAFEARGWDSVTLSKGTVGSLARIHTSRDIADACSGAGSAAAARLLHAASVRLLAQA